MSLSYPDNKTLTNGELFPCFDKWCRYVETKELLEELIPVHGRVSALLPGEGKKLERLRQAQNSEGSSNQGGSFKSFFKVGKQDYESIDRSLVGNERFKISEAEDFTGLDADFKWSNSWTKSALATVRANAEKLVVEAALEQGIPIIRNTQCEYCTQQEAKKLEAHSEIGRATTHECNVTGYEIKGAFDPSARTSYYWYGIAEHVYKEDKDRDTFQQTDEFVIDGDNGIPYNTSFCSEDGLRSVVDAKYPRPWFSQRQTGHKLETSKPIHWQPKKAHRPTASYRMY